MIVSKQRDIRSLVYEVSLPMAKMPDSYFRKLNHSRFMMKLMSDNFGVRACLKRSIWRSNVLIMYSSGDKYKNSTGIFKSKHGIFASWGPVTSNSIFRLQN